MSCFSTSLDEVVKNSDEARLHVQNLEKGLKDSAEKTKKYFEQKRDEFFTNAGLDDIQNSAIQDNTKVEFAQEFSLDKVIPAVQNAIKVAVQTYAVGTPIGANTQQAFSDLVVAIGECAKFSSAAAASMSYASNRLSPGLFVSLYATSTTIEDKNMFGKKAVTATMFYYQLSTSNKDIGANMLRELTLMYAQQVINLNRKLLDLADAVANGDITLDSYKDRKKTIQGLIDEMKPVLASYKKDKPEQMALVKKLVDKETKATHFKSFKNLNLKGITKPKVKIDSAKLLTQYNDTLASLLD